MVTTVTSFQWAGPHVVVSVSCGPSVEAAYTCIITVSSPLLCHEASLDKLKLDINDTMSTAVLAVIAVILCVLFRILNVNSQPCKPSVYCKDLNFLETILKIAPVLQEPYIPTRLWGFSGHVQTIVHSIVGRVKCPWPLGERVYLNLKDGTTLTYDLYQPLDTSIARLAEDDFTLAICPGIGNTSESVYIRTFVHYAQCHGYRCAVLNHVGALSSVVVTAPRIFTYGHTGDYAEMITNIVERHPNTKIVSIGFSLGGNLITKYMGEPKVNRPKNIIGGISVCQGYSATERVHSFSSVSEMYTWSSCLSYLPGIKTPMVFINARDDPIVPEPLLEPIRNFSVNNDKALYLELAHGGHLGFYEGGLMYPNPVTWLDRTLVALVGGLAHAHANDSKAPIPPPMPSYLPTAFCNAISRVFVNGQQSRTIQNQM
ncbi:hypothetical protein J437_LFUL007779 [Ladona fulva]|uniref:AB hydrolase-1 domain-containing protein n=1 Tax=Ladona fulva TaxID=123851 RepID=A0A8K0K311_LADFU|nr:hypothetical protein J437_LFUL007779 [Ladona fulva]